MYIVNLRYIVHVICTAFSRSNYFVPPGYPWHELSLHGRDEEECTRGRTEDSLVKTAALGAVRAGTALYLYRLRRSEKK